MFRIISVSWKYLMNYSIIECYEHFMQIIIATINFDILKENFVNI